MYYVEGRELSAEELSRAATFRGIETPSPSTDTEKLSMRASDWAILSAAAAAVAAVALWEGAV